VWKWMKRRAQDEQDLRDEIQFHLAEEAKLRIDAGDAADDAATAARRAFGNVALMQERTRDTWSYHGIETTWQDVRYGLRLLSRYRLFAAFSILALGLGIGGTTAIFTLYNAIVLRPLPVHDPDSLIALAIQGTRLGSNSFMPYPQFEAMRQQNQTLTGLFARTGFPSLSVSAHGTSAIASGLAVTGDYHGTLGLQPAAGRLLLDSDDRPGHANVAVLSYAYWQRRFSGDPGIVGQTITLNRAPFTVVGVEPKGFFGVTMGSTPDVTIPLRGSPEVTGGRLLNGAFSTWLEVMGRVRSGVSMAAAHAELDGIFRQVSLAAGATATNAGDVRFANETHVVVTPGARGGVSGLRNGYEEGLRLLLMILGGVLVLASLNIAALLLSRSEARKQEIAIRLALGAGRFRVIRQLLTESALLAICGSALGLWLAWRGSEMLLRVATSASGALPIDLTPDLRTIAFAGGVCIISALVFGVLPALRGTSIVGNFSRGTVSPRGRRLLDRSLVVSQTALALVVVMCAGLLIRSLQMLWTQDTGYDRTNVLMLSIDAGLIGTRGPKATEMYRRVLDELRTIPGAQSVSVSTVRPVSNSYYLIDVVSGVGDQHFTNESAIRVAFNQLGPGYFATTGTPIIAGREFDGRETPGGPPVAIISEQLARRFTGNPVGQRLTMGKETREVIGVAADTRYARVKDAPRSVVYLPFLEQQSPRFPPSFVIKYSGSPDDTLRAAGAAIARIDPALAPFNAKTLETQTRESFARERLLASLTTYFGAFAWLLAGIGLYGLTACTVAERVREFGLRMALGAAPSTIRWSVMRQSAGTVVAGLTIGLAAALLILRVVRTQLYRVEPADPVALMGAILALLALSCCAAFIPARRASRIDPMTTLRQE
jgi:predicted permease